MTIRWIKNICFDNKKYKKEITKSIASEKPLNFTCAKDFNTYINRLYANRLINGIPRIICKNDVMNFYMQYQQYLFSKLIVKIINNYLGSQYLLHIIIILKILLIF